MKKIAALFMVILLLASAVQWTALAEEQYGETGTYLDFEDFVAGKSGSYYKTVLQYKGSAETGEDPVGNRGKDIALNVAPESAGDNSLIFSRKLTDDCVFGISLYLDENATGVISAKGAGNVWGPTAITDIVRFDLGNIKFMGAKDVNKVGVVESAGWYDVRIWFDYTAHKLHIFLNMPNGESINKVYNINEQISGNEYITLGFSAGTKEYQIKADDVLLYDIGKSDFSYQIEYAEDTFDELNIVFNRDVIAENLSEEISVTENGTKVSFSVQPEYVGGFIKRINLIFDEEPDVYGEYILTLSDKILSLANETACMPTKLFNVEPEIRLVSDASGSSLPVGTSIKIKADVKKPRDARVIYVINGEKTEADGGELVYEVIQGGNEVYGKIVNRDDEVIAESEPLTFTGKKWQTISVNTEDDFDARSKPLASFRAESGYGTAEITNGIDGGNHVLQMTTKAKASLATYAITRSIEDSSEGKSIVYEAKFNFADFNAERALLQVKANRSNGATVFPNAPFIVTTDGELMVNCYLNNKLTRKSIDMLEKNHWYCLKAVYHLVSQTVDCYLDGFPVSINQRIWDQNTVITKILYSNISTGVPAEAAETTMYMDDVLSYETAPCVTYTSSLQTGLQNYKNLIANIEFSENMQTENFDTLITVTDSNGKTVSYQGDCIDGHTYRMSFEELVPNSVYTVTIGDIKSRVGADIDGDKVFTFKTDKKPFCIKEMNVRQSDNILYIDCTVRFDAESECGGILDACVYSNDAMIASDAVRTVKANSTEHKYQFEMETASQMYDSITVYLFDGAETLRLIDSVTDKN